MASNIKNKIMETAEAKFTRRQQAVTEGAKAMAEYQAEGQAVRARTAKLRAARLARDAGSVKAAVESKPAKPPRKRREGGRLRPPPQKRRTAHTAPPDQAALVNTSDFEHS